MDVNEEVNFVKIQKKIVGGRVGGGGCIRVDVNGAGVGLGGMEGCERRSEVFVKNKEKSGWGGVGSAVGEFG